MRSLIPTILASLAGLSSAADTQSPDPRFVGAWRLVSVETIRPSGEIIFPFYGRHPEGLLQYSANGWMSVEIVSDPAPARPSFDSREAFLAAPPDEKAAAANGFYGYWGTWDVDEAASTIRHHIAQSFYPAERGETGVRHFAFEGNRLTLTAKTHEMGEDHERMLVWERLPPK